MITNGTEYLKAINDAICLGQATDETKNALASLSHVPDTHMIIAARAYLRGVLRCVEGEVTRINAECKAWEGSPEAAREAMNDISLGMAFPQRGRDMEKVA